MVKIVVFLCSKIKRLTRALIYIHQWAGNVGISKAVIKGFKS